MELRLASQADADAVTALLWRSYPVLLGPDYPDDVLDAALPQICYAQPDLLTSGTYFLITAGELCLGAGGWTRDKEIGSKAHIRHLVTDPDHLRQGIARRLITHTLADARQSGVVEMEVVSTRTAVPFYTAMGFTQPKPFDLMLGNEVAFPSVQMTQQL